MTKMIPARWPIRLLLVCALLLPCAQAQTIRAVTETTPWTYLRDGKPAGSATQIVEMTLQKAGLADYTVSVYPWARSYDMALHEPNVLIYMIARTPERERLFKWTGEFMKIEYHLFKLKERKDVVVKALGDTGAYTIGVIRDDVRHQYMQRRGHARLVVSAESIDNFRRLLNRQVDLIPLTETEAASLCARTQFECSSIEKVYALDEMSTALYMAYSASTADSTVERTRAAFEQVKAAGALKLLSRERSSAGR